MGNIVAMLTMRHSATSRLHDVQGLIARYTKAREALLTGGGGVFGSLLGISGNLNQLLGQCNNTNTNNMSDKAKESLDKFFELEIQRLQTIASMLEQEIQGAQKGIDSCIKDFAPKFSANG